MYSNEIDAVQDGAALNAGMLGNHHWAHGGHVSFTRHDGAAMVTINRQLSPELAAKVDAMLRDLIEADDMSQEAEKAALHRRQQQVYATMGSGGQAPGGLAGYANGLRGG